jgi:hypothetical protein
MIRTVLASGSAVVGGLSLASQGVGKREQRDYDYFLPGKELLYRDSYYSDSGNVAAELSGEAARATTANDTSLYVAWKVEITEVTGQVAVDPMLSVFPVYHSVDTASVEEGTTRQSAPGDPRDGAAGTVAGAAVNFSSRTTVGGGIEMSGGGRFILRTDVGGLEHFQAMLRVTRLHTRYPQNGGGENRSRETAFDVTVFPDVEFNHER